jgi:eukaryotic-like serine/threonine-protein kinase
VNDLVARTRADVAHRRANLLLPQRLVFEQIEHVQKTAPPNDTPKGVEEVIPWAGAPDRSPEGRADSPWPTSGAAPVLVMLATVPVGLVALAAAWRGGLSMLLAGIAVVRADGRPAYRRQCAFRAAVVWMPVAALLLAAGLIQVYTPGLAYLAAGLWLTAAALLPIYAVLAIRQPARPPQDHIAGTYLVPV